MNLTVRLIGLQILKIRNGLLKLFGIPIFNIHGSLINNMLSYRENTVSSQMFDDKVAFILTGGVGDYIVSMNYICNFKKKFNYKIDLYLKCNENIADNILYNQKFYNKTYFNLEPREDKYNLIIFINRFPEVKFFNLNSIFANNKCLISYVKKIVDFRESNPIFFDLIPKFDGVSAQLCINNNIKRFQQPDIINFFNISEDFLFVPKVSAEYENRFFSKFKILNKYKDKIITIHRGCDVNQTKNSTKLWLNSYYNKLISYIKKEFKNVFIIQLGISEDRCEKFNNVDLCLVGKTSFEDIMVLLKLSALHIDCEGGFVHLRHSLCKKTSAVIFGPTNPNFYGYKENINIKSDYGCLPCEWFVEDWQSRCTCSNSHKCMKQLLPEIVYSKIKYKIYQISDDKNNIFKYKTI